MSPDRADRATPIEQPVGQFVTVYADDVWAAVTW